MPHPRRCWLWLLCLAVGCTFAAELEDAPPGTFSIVVIPDTQAYLTAANKPAKPGDTDLHNDVLRHHIDWILEHLESQRVIFVSQVGDLVDINQEAQWTVAKAQLSRLDGHVPYGLVPGNHDMTGKGNTSLFQRFFPASLYAGQPWYLGCYAGQPDHPEISGNNANSAQLVSAEGVEFVILHLECNAPDDVLAWADKVMDQHIDRHAIVVTHMDLGPRDQPQANEDYISAPKGRMTWHKTHGGLGNSPQQMWDKCYRKHANLGLIFSGDQRRTSAFKLTTTGDHGNVVHALMSDYTSTGPLRIYRFIPAENKLRVITWDTTRDERVEATPYVPDRDQHQFELPYPMR